MQAGGPPGNCCEKYVYVDMNTTPPSFSTEGKEDGDPEIHIPLFSANAVTILVDLIQNPDAWREEHDDSNSGLPGVGPKTGRLMQRATFCEDTITEFDGAPQYDIHSSQVG